MFSFFGFEYKLFEVKSTNNETLLSVSFNLYVRYSFFNIKSTNFN